MKEKIKKVFEKVTVNLFIAWTNVAIFTYLVGLSICEAEYAAFVLAFPFLLIALQAFELHKKEKEIDELESSRALTAMIFHDRWVHAHNRVVIYKKHFGDLTPEMEKELTEGEKAAVEEETEKKKETKEEQS